MTYSEKEIMEYIEEEDAKFIRLAFRDAYGVQKNISIMVMFKTYLMLKLTSLLKAEA